MFENSSIADLAVGRSTVRQRILALLLAEPGTRLHLRAIQRRAGTSPGTASRELTKLVSAGLIEREAEGNQVYFRGSVSPFATMLRSLLMTAPTLLPGSAASPGAGIISSPPPRVGATPQDPEAHAAAVAAPAETTAEAGPEQVPAVATTCGVGRPEDSMPQAQRLAVAGRAAFTARADPLGLEAGATAAERIRAIYGERLRGVYLYGPRASVAAPADSDVDLLVVLDRIERYGEELDRTGTVCASLSLELGAIVSRVFVSEADWRDRTDGQLPGVRAEAVPL